MTNDKDKVRLLPCFNCGGRAALSTYKKRIGTACRHTVIRQHAVCKVCGTQTRVFKALGRAAKAWNTRTPDPQVTALVQAAGVLAYAEAEYRWKHDSEGDGHIETGRAWDRMRDAGKKVAAALAALQEQSK